MALRNLMIWGNRNSTPVCNSLLSSADSFRRELDDFFSGIGGLSSVTRSEKSTTALSPRINISGNGKSFELTAEMPGLDKKDIQLSHKDRVLTIKGQQAQDREEKEQKYYRMERRLGTFQRSFRMPENVDLDKVKASYDKGVLKVSLPRIEEVEAKPKRIEVKVN